MKASFSVTKEAIAIAEAEDERNPIFNQDGANSVVCKRMHVCRPERVVPNKKSAVKSREEIECTLTFSAQISVQCNLNERQLCCSSSSSSFREHVVCPD